MSRVWVKLWALALVVACSPAKEDDQAPKKNGDDATEQTPWVMGTECNEENKQCNDELDAYLNKTEGEIKNALSDNRCANDSECQLIKGYGFCARKIAISTVSVDEKLATQLIGDYNAALASFSKQSNCPMENPRIGARCQANQCQVVSLKWEM